MPTKTKRPDVSGSFKRTYEKNRKIILSRDEVCALCGMPVDKSRKFPDPLSASVDHIIPVSKGGHPSALDNLQLTHLICNEVKGSRLTIERNKDTQPRFISNRVLPQSMDWTKYRSE